MKLSGTILLMLMAYCVLFATECYAASCSVATTPVAFNSYNVFSASPTNSIGSIIIKCSSLPRQGMQATISISTGRSGTFNPRQMASSTTSERMSYNLYTNPSRSAIWGDGSGGTSTVTAGISPQSGLSVPIYGSIPARQNLSAGNYGDSLVVTVMW